LRVERDAKDRQIPVALQHKMRTPYQQKAERPNIAIG
jgi:DNA-binding Lrp family transcriptional regulator